MKSFALVLSLVSVISASPLSYYDSQQQQVALEIAEYSSYPGFNLDLNALRLVELDGQSQVWITELDKINAKAQGVKFFDITEAQELGSFAPSRLRNEASFPTPNAAKIVRPILKTLSIKEMRKNLEHFSSYRTRHYLSDTGKESQKWLFSRISEITEQYASESLRESITVEEFPNSWGQNSIIARIEGASKTDDGVVIIGAHLDSTNWNPYLPAPIAKTFISRADDDGSGTVTILEAYRGVISADFHPLRTIEFHWYSGEEGGLLGSQAIAKDYEQRGVNVVAMIQVDMTAWVKKGTNEEVGLITDFTNEGLTNFNKALVDLYLDIPYVETKCGFACSDHASWGKAGYPSAFTVESAFENSNNKNAHTVNDVIDISDEFSFEHMLEFCKLAIAFAVELGTPTTTSDLLDNEGTVEPL